MLWLPLIKVWFVPILPTLWPKLNIIVVLVDRGVEACDIRRIDCPLPCNDENFCSPSDAIVEITTTLPVGFIERVDDETEAIKDNLSITDIAALPLNIGVVETRTLWVCLNEGVTCAAGAKDETVTVRVGVNEGVEVIWGTLVEALDVSKRVYSVEDVRLEPC